MGIVFSFEEAYRREHRRRGATIFKTVDGKIVACVDIDCLTHSEREDYFRKAELQKDSEIRNEENGAQ